MEITLGGIKKVSTMLIEVMYEVTVQQDLAMAEGLLGEALDRLDAMASSGDAPEFTTPISSEDDVVKLLTQCLMQQLEAIEYVHNGNTHDVERTLADHLVALRAVSDFLNERLENGGI